jgi:hypothetical protein
MNTAIKLLAIAGLLMIVAWMGWSMRDRMENAGSHSVTEARLASVEAAVASRTPGFRSSTSRPPGVASFRRDPRALFGANGQAVQKQIDAGRQKLIVRYKNEPIDAAWSSRTQKALEDANTAPQIAELSAKPLSFASECRSSVCLIGADFPSVDAADDWYTLYSMLAGAQISNSAVHRSSNPDGTVHLEIYGLARGR